jgi:hypothetical protein
MNSRAAFPIIVLGAALCLLLVPYSYWFGGSYALVDDFSFIVRGPLPRLAQWLTIGRPGTYFYMEFVANALNGDLPFARLMALLLLAATSLTVYFSMRYRGHVATIAIGAALAIAANYAVDHLDKHWLFAAIVDRGHISLRDRLLQPPAHWRRNHAVRTVSTLLSTYGVHFFRISPARLAATSSGTHEMERSMAIRNWRGWISHRISFY